MNRLKIYTFTLLSVVMLAVTSAPSFAQVREGDNFEAGAGYHFTSATGYDNCKFNLNGPGAYFEYRYEDQSGIHFGGRLNYKYANGEYYEARTSSYDSNLHQICLEGLVGYTFLADCVASPFVGVGAGFGGAFVNKKSDNTNSFYLFWVLTPRVGVQLWKFRLSFDFDILSQRKIISLLSGKNSYNVCSTICSFNLGFTF